MFSYFLILSIIIEFNYLVISKVSKLFAEFKYNKTNYLKLNNYYLWFNYSENFLYNSAFPFLDFKKHHII